MDIKTILKNYGIEENLDSIESAIKGQLHEEFIPKKQYNKKINALDKLQEELDDIKAKGETNEYKSKFEELEKEYKDYKTSVETEKVNTGKRNALVGALKQTGFNDKIVKLLEKNFDLSKIELEGENIKGWDELVKPYKEEYSDFIAKDTTNGTTSSNPPKKIEGVMFTKEQIQNMTTTEINKNWDNISKSLAKQY